MASATATVETLTAEVRVLMVGKRQVTMSVFRQLDTVDWREEETFELFGRVRETRKDEQGFIHVVGKMKKTGVLVRSKINPDSKWANDPDQFWIGYRDRACLYSTALKEMRADIALPVSFHYDTSESRKDEIRGTVESVQSKLEKLEEVRSKADNVVREISSGKLPSKISFMDDPGEGARDRMIHLTWRSSEWWEKFATEEDFEERKVAVEAQEQAVKEFEAVRKIAKSNDAWMDATKSLDYIEGVLEELDHAVDDMKRMKLGKATKDKWGKLPLIILAGLT